MINDKTILLIICCIDVLLLANLSPDKDKWINVERARWAKYLNIPISDTTPPGFPINTISIQRVLTAISISHPHSLPSAISLFYQNFWVHYNEPTKPETLLAIVSTIVGGNEEAKKVVEASKGEEAKKKLSANTDLAFQEGAFGLPWFIGECVVDNWILQSRY